MCKFILNCFSVFLLFLFIPASAEAEILIQVQSSQDAVAAQKEAARLFQLGAPAFSRAEQLPEKGIWNRVYIGPFENEADAKAAAEALVKEGAIKEFVVKSGAAPEALPPAPEALPPAPEALPPAPEALPPSAEAAPPGNEPVFVELPAEAGVPIIGADGKPMDMGSDASAIAPEDQVAVDPSSKPLTPFKLPVAETPTYGEPVSPEQAREMGLGKPSEAVLPLPPYGEPGGRQVSVPNESGLAIYGEPGGPAVVTRPDPLAPKEGLPPGFKTGDDMPGLVLPAVPAPASGVDGRQPALLPPLPAVPAPASGVDGRQPALLPPLPAVPAPASGVDGRQPALLPPLPASPVPEKALDDGVNAPSSETDALSSLPLAPSAGEGAAIMVAQAGGEYENNERRRSNLGPMTLSGFAMLVDLSSSMRRMAPCGGRIKEEAVATLLRKMNRRIPIHPYTASLRVFGYKRVWTWHDFTMLYYGPATYDTNELENAFAKLAAADSMSPFAAAIDASESELQSMGNPKAVLMFADFEYVIGSGDPVQSASKVRRRYGQDISVYTFYVSRQVGAPKLAKDVAKAGGGKAYDICRMLDDETAFENMMMEIFGAGGNPCPDQDNDGVCDDDDLCPNTPPGAPVDERGCWIAAYSQFFDFDKDVVKKAFLPRIKHAAEVLNNNPGLPTVIIAGHTDSVGRPEYNMGLGLRRAEAVKQLLVQYGVAAGRLRTESYGQTRPVATNETEEGQARNRRVEFHIGEVPPHRENNY